MTWVQIVGAGLGLIFGLGGLIVFVSIVNLWKDMEGLK